MSAITHQSPEKQQLEQQQPVPQREQQQETQQDNSFVQEQLGSQQGSPDQQAAGLGDGFQQPMPGPGRPENPEYAELTIPQLRLLAATETIATTQAATLGLSTIRDVLMSSEERIPAHQALLDGLGATVARQIGTNVVKPIASLYGFSLLAPAITNQVTAQVQTFVSSYGNETLGADFARGYVEATQLGLVDAGRGAAARISRAAERAELIAYIDGCRGAAEQFAVAARETMVRSWLQFAGAQTRQLDPDLGSEVNGAHYTLELMFGLDGGSIVWSRAQLDCATEELRPVIERMELANMAITLRHPGITIHRDAAGMLDLDVDGALAEQALTDFCIDRGLASGSTPLEDVIRIAAYPISDELRGMTLDLLGLGISDALLPLERA